MAEPKVMEAPTRMFDRPRGLSVFSALRRPDAPPMTEEEREELMDYMRDSAAAQELSDKMGTADYWIDTLKRFPAAIRARMMKVHPETGEAIMEFRAPMPDLDDVGRGLMTMEEYKAEKAAVEAHNRRLDEYRSTWVDDTKSMAALPALLGNLLGGDFEPPEFAVEAAQRVGAAERKSQEDFGMGDPEGFPQHLMGGAGAMMTQIPIPGTQGKGALSQAVKKVPTPIRAPVGAVIEMANPTINPSVQNYLKGALAAGAIDTFLEPSASQIAEIEERQRLYDNVADKVDIMIEEQWDDTPMETKLAIFTSPFADQAWEAMDAEQREEILKELQARGAFDDAE